MNVSLFAQGLILLAAMYLAPGLIFPESLSYFGFLALAVTIIGWTYYRGRLGRGPIW